MVLSLIIWLLSLGISATVYFLFEFPAYWWLFFVNILALPIIYLLIFAVLIIIFFIWGLFINKKKERKNISPFHNWLVRNVNTILVILSRAKVHAKNKELLDPNEKYLFVCNHVSNFDQMVIIKEFQKRRIICISKPGNFKIPVCGPFIHRAGYISINREDNFEAAKAIIKASNYLKKEVCDICIAPEGTRAKDYKLHDFKPGSFKTAYKAMKPIVVVGLKNTEKIHKNFPFKGTNVYMHVLEVIPYEKYKDMNTVGLAEYCHGLIQKFLEENE